MKIGKRLREVREETHMTQNDVSKKLNIPLGTVVKYEDDILEPSVETLILFCRLLHVSADYLMGLTDER